MVTKTILQLVSTAAVLLVASFAVSGQSGHEKKPRFACNMSGLTAAQRKDLSAAIHRLIDAKPTVTELPNGYRLAFDHAGDLYPMATTWIQYERLCCPFFKFSITLEEDNGPMVVQLMGDKGVKEFIDADLPALRTLTHSVK